MNFRNKWFKLVCHQREDRCFKFGSEPMIVCSRCFGIYLGTFVTLAILLFVYGFFTQPIVSILTVLFIAPLGIDGVVQLIWKRESNNTRRFVTGYIGGFALAYFVYSAVSRIIFGSTGGIPLPGYELYLGLPLVAVFFYLMKKSIKARLMGLKKFLDLFSVSMVFSLVVVVLLVYSIMFANKFLI